jgi:hypothetical protein
MRMLGEVLNDLREVLQRHVDEKSGDGRVDLQIELLIVRTTDPTSWG